MPASPTKLSARKKPKTNGAQPELAFAAPKETPTDESLDIQAGR